MKLGMKTMPNRTLSTMYIPSVTATAVAQVLDVEAMSLNLCKPSVDRYNTIYSLLMDLL
jgi:hypothetical protein